MEKWKPANIKLNARGMKTMLNAKYFAWLVTGVVVLLTIMGWIK